MMINLGYLLQIYSKSLFFPKSYNSFNVKKNKENLPKKKILINTYTLMNLGSGNGGGNSGSKTKIDWNDNSNYISFIIFLFFILSLIRIYIYSFCEKWAQGIYNLKSTLFKHEKYDEIVLKNCELLPIDFISFNFKFILNKNFNQTNVFKILTITNRWYKEKDYIFSLIKETNEVFSGNLYQIIFSGVEPKIKSIKIKKKKKSSIIIVSDLIKLKSGKHFKWRDCNWSEFCKCGLFTNANFEAKLIKTNEKNTFLDIIIDFDEENTLTIQPGITFEQKNFSGIILTQTRNFFGKGINLKSSIIKNPLNELFLTVEFKKLLYPMTRFFFSCKKINEKGKRKIFKIAKIFGKRYREKFEIFYENTENNELFIQKKNRFISNLSLNFFKTIKTGKNSKILTSYNVATYKKKNLSKGVNFGFSVNFSKRIFSLRNNLLCPKFKLKTVLKASRNILKKDVGSKFYSKEYFEDISTYERSIPVGICLDFITIINKNISFYIFMDVFKCLKKNIIFEKSTGLGMKFNNIFSSYFIITSNGQLKILIDTL
nr:hypothetical protein 1634Bnrm2_p105 [Cryptomonas sp.]